MIQIIRIIALNLCVLSSFSTNCRTGFQPGQKGTPAEKPQVFLPGIVCTEAHEFSCTYSTDMNEFYFNRGKDIMMTKKVDGRWSESVYVSFNSDYLDNEPCILPSGILLFGSDRPHNDPENPGDYGIWIVRPVPGGWSSPSYVGAAAFISSTSDGIIYTRSVKPDYRRGCIVRTSLVENRLDSIVPQTGGLLRPSQGYLQGVHPSISPDGSYMVFTAMKGRWGNNPDLFLSFNLGGDRWSEAVNLSNILGMHNIFTPYISPDGSELFFYFEHDIYHVETAFIHALKGAL
jgi:hypothetical protein